MRRVANWALAISLLSAWPVSACVNPTITITSSPATIGVNQPVTLTATFSGSPTATGQAQFFDNGNNNGAFSPVVNLTGGVASLNVPANSMAVGTNVITLAYTGDSNYCFFSVSPANGYTLAVTSAVTAPVPDLSPWGISLTALLLLSAGLAMSRRAFNS